MKEGVGYAPSVLSAAELAGNFDDIKPPLDTAHQAIAARRIEGARRIEVIDAECVGCSLCQHVCPAPDCVTMVEVDTGLPPSDWSHDERNPYRLGAQ